MEWDPFFTALGMFIIKIGVPSLLILSIPVLIWKRWDMRSKIGK